MPIINKLPTNELEELKSHEKETSKEFIKTYTLRQLSYIEWVDTRTIKNSWRYLPVRIDTYDSLYNFKKWLTKKPYSVKYIRLDEIKDIFNRKTGKKLHIE